MHVAAGPPLPTEVSEKWQHVTIADDLFDAAAAVAVPAVADVVPLLSENEPPTKLGAFFPPSVLPPLGILATFTMQSPCLGERPGSRPHLGLRQQMPVFLLQTDPPQ